MASSSFVEHEHSQTVPRTVSSNPFLSPMDFRISLSEVMTLAVLSETAEGYV